MKARRNKKPINNLAFSGIRSNIKKYMTLIFAVILTTMLFSSLFTISGSMISEMQTGSMRQVGTSAHTVIKKLDQSEYDQIKDDDMVKDIACRIVVGREFTEDLVDFSYFEPEDAKMTFCYPEEGRLPEKENEIVTSDLVLEKLGVPSELGTEFDVTIKTDDDVITQRFTLVGYFRGDALAPIQQALVSKEFQEKYAPSGQIVADVKFGNSVNKADKTQELLERYNLTDSVNYEVNWAYMSNDIDSSIIVMGAGLVLIFFFAGYLIIYNIFDINIISDMQEYGLLKTIGTSGKQIRKIVKKRARLIAFAGIPIGTLLGIAIGSYILPIVSNSFSTVNVDKGMVHVNFWMIALSAVFSYITVMISAGRPCRKAAKVSPVETLKITEKTGKNGKPKRKYLVVILSISLSLVILNSVLGFVGGFNMDEYVRDLVIADFSVQSKSIDDPTYQVKDTAGVDETFMEEIECKDGVKDVGKVYVCGYNQTFNDEDWATIENGFLKNELVRERLAMDYGMNVNDYDVNECIAGMNSRKVLDGKTYGMNEYAVSKLKVIKSIDGTDKIDWEKFNSGNYVLITRWCYDEWYQDEDMYVNFFEPGDKINVCSKNPEYAVLKSAKDNGTEFKYEVYEGGPEKEYEVYAVVEIPEKLGKNSLETFHCDYIFPENEYISLNGDRGALRVILDVEDNKEAEVSAFLEEYIAGTDPDLSYTSKDSIIKEYANIGRMIKVVGIFLAVTLGFIGLMNFANTMVTSIFVRSRELAMLEAVGMTGKQQKKKLVKEGFTYFVWTAVVSLGITSVLSITVLKAFMSEIPIFDWNFTLSPIMLTLPIILVLVILIPRSAYRKLSKTSVIDRLRVQ